MDPIHIHNLLRQISSEVKCPHCEASVRPDMVSVQGSSESYCLLKIGCHKCNEIFFGHAHVGVKVLPPDQQSALPSPRKSRRLPPTPPMISEADIRASQEKLKESNWQISQFLP